MARAIMLTQGDGGDRWMKLNSAFRLLVGGQAGGERGVYAGGKLWALDAIFSAAALSSGTDARPQLSLSQPRFCGDELGDIRIGVLPDLQELLIFGLRAIRPAFAVISLAKMIVRQRVVWVQAQGSHQPGRLRRNRSSRRTAGAAVSA